MNYSFDGLTGAAVDARAPAATGRRAQPRSSLVEVLSAYRVGFGGECGRGSSRPHAGYRGCRGRRHRPRRFRLRPPQRLRRGDPGAYRDEARLLLPRARAQARGPGQGRSSPAPAAKRTVWEGGESAPAAGQGAFAVWSRSDGRAGPRPRAAGGERPGRLRRRHAVWRLPERPVARRALARRPLPERGGDGCAGPARQRPGQRGQSSVSRGSRVGVAPRAWRCPERRRTAVSSSSGTSRSACCSPPPACRAGDRPRGAGRPAQLPPDDRDLLLATFEAWVEADGSARAARHHPVLPLTWSVPPASHRHGDGSGHQRPADIAELVAATRAWFQLPHRATS
ncbi:hypothetical protein HBB16_10425 [Pseudonocardia sp. MCCB 268]|nr:hypothetical protein [Pseudonocardia cytotoxica]